MDINDHCNFPFFEPPDNLAGIEEISLAKGKLYVTYS